MIKAYCDECGKELRTKKNRFWFKTKEIELQIQTERELRYCMKHLREKINVILSNDELPFSDLDEED